MLRRLTQYLILGALLLVTGISTQAEQTPPQPLKIGRGSIEWADWHPDGATIMVSTVNGAWLYTKDLQDLAHIPEARLARFSPDGRYIAGVDDKHLLRLWDAHTLQVVKSTPDFMKGVQAFAWHPDSQKLAISIRGDFEFTTIWDFTADDANSIAYVFFPQMVWSTSGTYLAALQTMTGAVIVWETKSTSKEIVFNYTSEYSFTGGYDLTWRNDDQLLYIQYDEHSYATLWQIPDGQVIQKMDIGTASMPTYNASGSYLATVGMGINVREVATDKALALASLGPTTAWSNGLAWRPDGNLLVAEIAYSEPAYQSELLFFDPQSGEVTDQANGPLSCNRLIRWHPYQDLLLLIGCNDDLAVYDLISEQASIQPVHSLITGTADWKDDGTQLAIADGLGSVYLWDTRFGENIGVLPGATQPVFEIDWQPGGELLTTRGGTGWRTLDNTVYLWDTVQQKLIHSFIYPPITPVVAVEWNPDGIRLAVASRGRSEVYIESITDPTESKEIQFYEGISNSDLQWNRDGTELAVAFYSSTSGVWVWNAINATSQLSGTSNSGSHQIWTVTGDLMWLNWYSRESVRGLMLRLNDEVITENNLPGITAGIVDAFLSPSGSIAIAIDENYNGLAWSTASREVLFTLGGIKTGYWSPDEKFLAVRRLDNQIWILKADGTVHIRLTDDLTGARILPEWSAIPPETVVWSADSQRLAHIYGGTVAIWDIEP